MWGVRLLLDLELISGPTQGSPGQRCSHLGFSELSSRVFGLRQSLVPSSRQEFVSIYCGDSCSALGVHLDQESPNQVRSAPVA